VENPRARRERFRPVGTPVHRRSRTAPPGVRTGLEVLVADRFRALRGLRVGLVCNPTSVDRRLRHAADLMKEDSRVNLVALFGPEHGVRGDAPYMAAVGDERDASTGLPVHSLYGTSKESLSPRGEDLARLDALVFDIQDVGARYYTYQATMMLCMEAAARSGVRFIVLDRPNPLGGLLFEGPRLCRGFESFCGLHDLAPRHGLTVGELAHLFRSERGLSNLELSVVECRGWRRRQGQEETGLPWVFPSPNMPTPATALVYPGMCLLEGTNLSEGRGTTRPFELFGAPWLRAEALVDALAREGLPGVLFRPASFVPGFDKHAGQRCFGAELFVVDRASFRPVLTGLACVAAARHLDPGAFAWRTAPYEFAEGVPAFDLLCGSAREREGIEAGKPIREMAEAWVPEEAAFARRRRVHMLYG